MKQKRNLLATRLLLSLLAVLTASTAWADAVTLSVDNEIAVGTAGHYYVNMPATGTNTLSLSDATITTFKVYDDGGKDGNYSNNCRSTLVLTAPEGYVLQLSGNITTESHDYLTVYDGTDNSASALLNAVSSTSSGTQTDIGPVFSSGQSMTLYFFPDGSTNYSGLDLTVTLVDATVEYNITVNNPETGGSVVSDKSKAKVNDMVTLTATPSDGYMLSGLSVVDVSSNAVAVTDMLWYANTNTATFTMLVSAVTVTPTFTNTLTADGGLYINMPQTGTKTVTIPTGVQSFKVYDDGGKDGNYSNDCSGTLTLTAPEGYVLQLSGSITAESGYDYLTVYDKSSASGPKLLNAVKSSTDGTETAITTVASTGQSMTLYFYSDGSTNYAGLDLTVTLVDPNKEYGITVNNATGGSVASDVSKAKENDVVTLTATPSDGYMLSGISITGTGDNAVPVAWDGPFFNTATFTMPRSAVTVTPTFTNTLTADGGLYINMPQTGTQTLTIPTGVQSFKVYDDGGASGNYSNNCNGTLVLTAPEGYVLQLSGNITTEESWDNLTVYDNNAASGTKLLDAVKSSTDGTQTAITTVASTGQSMTLYFSSDDSGNYAGLDLTVTLINPNTEYGITVNNATGGSVASDKSTAKVNDVVTLTATPGSGYVLSDLSVVDGSSNAVAVTDMLWYANTNTATFTMPGSAVTVTPTFTNDLTSLYINMPTTGTKTATIPSGVQSFKVYDDGGASGNYSNNCNGTLVLTAPTGYLLQLSGSITAESGYDYLTVYDNSAASGTKLLDAVSSTTDGTQTAITTVASSGQSLTLYFYSDGNGNYAGLDLTVTLIKIMALADNADNTEAINGWKNGLANVTLSDRKLYKDGSWNTLCLPFDVNSFSGTLLDGATVKELDKDNSNLAADGTLTLTFSTVTSIEAGKPYIVKWEGASGTVADPVFEGVEISETAPVAVEFANISGLDACQFVGQYSPFSIGDTSNGTFDGDLNEIIMLGSGSRLGYSQNARTLNCFRAHFLVPTNGPAGSRAARAFVLDFGDGDNATGIKTIDNLTIYNLQFDADGWYDLNGRRINGQPTAKGVYIQNGKKVVIK